MIPIVPKGVETLDILRPLGLVQESSTLPTGSSKLAISFRVVAIDCILSSLSFNLSINESDKFLFIASFISFLFASNIFS